MAFPNTVDAQAQSPNQPAQYGPFFNGSSIYLFVCSTPDQTNFFASARVSTNGGVTWTESDIANRPQIVGATSYCCAQLGTNVYVFAVDPNTGSDVTVSRFDLVAKTWTTGLATLAAAITSLAVSRTSDIILLTQTSITTQGVVHSIASFAAYNVAGNSWSAVTPMDFSDYASSANWNTEAFAGVLDSSGNVQIATQQYTWAGNGVPVDFFLDSDTTFTVPADCSALLSIVVQAGGGGGDNAVGGQGGGAGGRAFIASQAVTAGTMLAVFPGQGGVGDQDGGASSFNGLSATGGSAGNHTSLGGVGNGGSANLSGGNGLAGIGGVRAGNGGGLPTNSANGVNGAGGLGGTLTPPAPGGNGPGGGGNGESLATGGSGSDGFVSFNYIPIRGDFSSRGFIQSILPNNSLGSLTYIPQLDFPEGTSVNDIFFIPMALVAIPGSIVIAFSGANFTSGYDFMAVGQASNSTTPAFSFNLYSTGNSGSGANPGLSLAAGGSNIYLVYLSSPSLSVATVKYILNGGSPVTLGSGNFNGALISVGFNGTLQIAFGAPTTAQNSYVFST